MWLKRKRSKNPDINTKSNEKKLKVKVEPFGLTNSHYHILYKLPGNIIWMELTYSILYGDESLCSRDQPFLYKDFDIAVKKAKSLTIKSIYEIREEEDLKFDQHIIKLRNLVNSRNKTFEQ